jgi:hypothetical protein
MFSNKLTLKVITTFMLVTSLASSSGDVITQSQKSQSQNTHSHPVVLDVYKSPSCECCNKWISHINENGFEANIHSSQNFSVIKNDKGIAPQYRSCHTAISKGGYAFEGHVPAKFIQQFLKEKHAGDVIGLSVPAMPVGTPGMEVDDRFQPYNILLLKSDGLYEIYAGVQAYKEQF